MQEYEAKYFEEKFSSVMSKLDSIHGEVKRTNGRVTDLEKQVRALELEEAKHEIRCPQVKRIVAVEQALSDTNKNLIEYNLFKKYPKVVLGSLALLLLIAFKNLSESIAWLGDMFGRIKMP
jgi:hypothetical protein